MILNYHFQKTDQQKVTECALKIENWVCFFSWKKLNLILMNKNFQKNNSLIKMVNINIVKRKKK